MHTRHPAQQSEAPVIPDDEHLAENRIRFLTADSINSGVVRDVILASWQRSRQCAVPADRVEVPYFHNLNLDTPLIHSTEPVLRRLGEQLDGQPISLILTDPTGAVLSQRTGDPDLQRHLERVHLAPGFSYGEQFVGTNGIGTALEGGGPMHVFGHEHYAENLENLACAGIPIHHPVSGKTIGVIDLTCWSKDAGKLLVALARSAAEQIQQALLTTSSIRDLELFQAYLQACQHTSDVVIALNNNVAMMNEQARHTLDPDDQAALLTSASQVLSEGQRTTTAELPSGAQVRIRCRRISGDNEAPSGGVLHVKFVTGAEDTKISNCSPTSSVVPHGLVGSTPVWLRSCHEVDDCCAHNEWMALTGEPGVGKTALVSRMYQWRNPRRRLRVLDAATAGSSWLDTVRHELFDQRVNALLIRRADRLDRTTANALAAMLSDVRDRNRHTAPWIAVTLNQKADPHPDLVELLARLSRTVHVPPLRYRLDDLRELVPFFLRKLAPGGNLTCSHAAMQLLLRSTWPGNITQLHDVLKQIVHRCRRSGTIQPNDLPANYHTVTRRPLTQLESMERDAIVHNLNNTNGNKIEAAKRLGISRATLYRKIRDYGIVT